MKNLSTSNIPLKPTITSFFQNKRKKKVNIHSNKLKKNIPTIFITHRPISLPTNTYNKPLNGKLTK